MELKLVYRILRKISDWTVSGYYSEVYVEGYENVSEEGPVIIASTHHNEMIDIATLAMTIPHRRHLSFWAKSSMFKHPVTGFIMSSSGAIPVKRNPNRENAATTSAPVQHSDTTQSELFASTSLALARNEVVGVFPEGTSYTQPSIMQIMSGAGWAAVEFAKWEKEQNTSVEGEGKGHGNREGLVIVPVGIVYTDKSEYLSRVKVNYGTPISIASYTAELFDDTSGASPDERSRTVVKKIMAKVEQELFDITINASDWETLYSARVMREILWGEESNIKLTHWVVISQSLINMLTPSSSSASPESLRTLKASLTRYFSLMHHACISHPLLESVLPISLPPSAEYPSRIYHLQTLATRFLSPFALVRLPITLTQGVLFLPALLAHIPAYVMSRLVVKFLASSEEEEGIAQFAGVGGGIGFWAAWAAGSGTLVSKLIGRLIGLVETASFGKWGVNMLRTFCDRTSEWALGSARDRVVDVVQRICAGKLYNSLAGRIARTLLCGWLMVKWYGLFINGFHRKYKLLAATFRLRILGALVQPSSWALPKTQLEPYTHLPPPPANEFIKKRQTPEQVAADIKAPKPIAPYKLTAALLHAREDARLQLRRFLREQEQNESKEVEWLLSMSARVP